MACRVLIICQENLHASCCFPLRNPSSLAAKSSDAEFRTWSRARITLRDLRLCLICFLRVSAVASAAATPSRSQPLEDAGNHEPCPSAPSATSAPSDFDFDFFLRVSASPR